jgi:hypothetical protein
LLEVRSRSRGYVLETATWQVAEDAVGKIGVPAGVSAQAGKMAQREKQIFPSIIIEVECT